MKNKFKKQRFNAVFNYSNIELTPAMESVLNKGLNFVVLPPKLDLTQTLVEHKRFERTMTWIEYFHNQENSEPAKPVIFKTKKHNLPKNHKTPKHLKGFFAATKSDLLDPQNRHKVASNIPEDEKQAINTLIKLQRERKLVIKVCDKGAGIFLLNFDSYVKACDEHLLSETPNKQPYYSKVDEKTLLEAENKLNLLLEEGLNNKYISKQEYEAMKPVGLIPGKLYCNFKIHKKHNHEAKEIPPVRPIVSCSGSMLENAAIFVQHHLKDVANKHATYLQDTPDFLRQLEQHNNETILPNNAKLVVIDVVGLYTNIPQQEGVECVQKRLETNMNSEVPGMYVTRLLELLMKYNVFQFNEVLYQQIVGTAMGSAPAPDYANIFMDMKIDKKIMEIANKYSVNNVIPLKFMKRFLDDIFAIYTGSIESLHKMFNELNTIHPTIKFTMSHTTPATEEPHELCPCERVESIPFLDTLCTIKAGKVVTGLYKKPTDTNQYLLTSSVHPAGTTENIPFSLAMRINRICTEEHEKTKQLDNLKDLLLARDYPVGVVTAAIVRAAAIPRDIALQHKTKQHINTRPIFVVTYDPRLPNIPRVVNKHYRAMVAQDEYLKDVFPEPPMVAHRRQKNIREYLIRAKVAPKIGRIQRTKNGMRKCNKPCKACPLIKETKLIKSDQFKWEIRKDVNCGTPNSIYLLECSKCEQRYIGESKRPIRERISEHAQYVRSILSNKATGEHFNLPGHSLANMKFTILEQAKKTDDLYRKQR